MAALPWLLGIVALLVVAPLLFTGRVSRWTELMTWLDEVEMRWTDQAPVAMAAPVGPVVGPTELQLGGSDPEGRSVVGWIVEQPAHGTLTREGAPLESPFVLGPVTYEPVPGYSGPEELAFEVRDRSRASDRLLVSFPVYAEPAPAPPLPQWPIAMGAPPAPPGPIEPDEVVERYLLRGTPTVDARERAVLADVNRAVESETGTERPIRLDSLEAPSTRAPRLDRESLVEEP